ncbi:phosphoribosylformylglycinamidine synthase I [Candidatus Micrarchaeota archaeon]|nr:phosphoribosylformylglycinamidine synthase I [Candidatus Micrarchaeota archaeon]
MQGENKNKPRAMVLRTAGTNCDYETLYCLGLAGFEAEAVHVNKLISGAKSLQDYRLLVLPGGFADGDYLGSGKILANKITYRLGRLVPQFVEQGNAVLGICNGFQVLVKAGLLPALEGKCGEQQVTLTFNESGHFQDEWIEMQNVNKARCAMVKGIKTIECPINHGEGRFIPASADVLRELYKKDLVVFKYAGNGKGKNPNGSTDDIAGICDETGRVLGLMPHPEKNHSALNHPHSTRVEMPAESRNSGVQLFRKIFSSLDE